MTVVPNRGSPPAILLRETYREAGKVKNRTLANLSQWKPEKIAALRAVLRDEQLLPAGEGFEIIRSLPHGHVAATLGIARRLGLGIGIGRAVRGVADAHNPRGRATSSQHRFFRTSSDLALSSMRHHMLLHVVLFRVPELLSKAA